MDTTAFNSDKIDSNTLSHYEPPRIISLTKRQILEEFGPARAQYPCTINSPECQSRGDFGEPPLP